MNLTLWQGSVLLSRLLQQVGIVFTCWMPTTKVFHYVCSYIVISKNITSFVHNLCSINAFLFYVFINIFHLIKNISKPVWYQLKLVAFTVITILHVTQMYFKKYFSLSSPISFLYYSLICPIDLIFFIKLPDHDDLRCLRL